MAWLVVDCPHCSPARSIDSNGRKPGFLLTWVLSVDSEGCPSAHRIQRLTRARSCRDSRRTGRTIAILAAPQHRHSCTVRGKYKHDATSLFAAEPCVRAGECLDNQVQGQEMVHVRAGEITCEGQLANLSLGATTIAVVVRIDVHEACATSKRLLRASSSIYCGHTHSRGDG